MNKFLVFSLVVLTSFLISCESEDMEEVPPNIVLFLVDDMGWQDTSVPFYSEQTAFNDRYHTPNMEKLAAQGMKFTQAYATPVCSPSRVSLMTGMNAARAPCDQLDTQERLPATHGKKPRFPAVSGVERQWH